MKIKNEDIFKLLKHYRLLFVDDDAIVRKYFNNMFSSFFKSVDYATDGQKAIEMIKKNAYDIVITDICMPKKDGFEVVKFIKEHYPEIITLILSSFFDTNTLLQSINVGVDGFLIKPFDIESFLKTVKNILSYKIRIDEELNILKQYKDIVDEDLIVSKTDIQGNITYVNDAFEKISGFKKDELIGQKHSIIRHPDMSDEVFKNLWETILNKKTWRGVIKNRKKNGESYYVDSIIKPILDRQGKIKEFIALRKDITNYIDAEKLINDKLQLINDALLILVGIDNYHDIKVVYDEDIVSKIKLRLLKRVKSLLREKLNIKHKDIEDYFVKEDVLGFLIEKYGENLEETMQEIVNEVNNMPLIVNGFEYYPFIRISYAYGNKHLYKNAVIGLEKIKDKEERVIFANGLCAKKKIEVLQNMEMLKTIEYALSNNKVISLYQPIVDNQTKKTVKYESLVRILDKNNKMISPFYFLEIAKKAGLYGNITSKVLENTFEVMDKKNIPVSINLSPSDILREKIREKIYTLLRDYSPEKGMVTFELLEDEIVKIPKTVEEFIKNIINLNANVAIDDFGSGYSNFSRIVEFKADIIKIDGILIKDIHNDKTKQDVVEAIVNFAKKENKKTVAEFVENEEIYKTLLKLGVDYSQGYYFSKPVLSDEI